MSRGSGVGTVGVLAAVVLAGVVALVAGCPHYNVYVKRLEGEGILAKGEAEKKVIVETAKAEAEAEKIRSAATVEAITTVGEKLSQYPEYTRHRFIEGLHDEKTEVIYLPIGPDGLPQMFTHPLNPIPKREPDPVE